VRVLFLASRFPFPLHRGDQLRAFEQLRVLGVRHRVTLACFESGPVDVAGQEAIRGLCESVVTVPLQMSGAAAGLARAAVSGLPGQAGIYQQPQMRRVVQTLLQSERFDLVHVQLARMAPYVEDVPFPRFVDLVDALSLGMRRRGRLHHGPVAWLVQAEARRLLAYERHLCATFEGACVASAADQEAIGGEHRPGLVPNGVDLTRFAFGRNDYDPRAIVFSGNLGYFANVDAVAWFAEQILPLVRGTVPEARFRVVGARPARALRWLARDHPAVDLIGPVADMAASLGSAAVAVAPMRVAAGQPNKVLEAMAVGVPVVATRNAVGGLGAGADAGLAIADTPEAFAEEVIRLLQDPARADAQAQRGRRFVEAHHRWDRAVALLEAQHHEACRGRGMARSRS
jgi:polysaccharide biosynthesis protein PslH